MKSVMPVQLATMGNFASADKSSNCWNELFDAEGNPREIYRPIFDRLAKLPRSQFRKLDEQLEATMREMGVTFDIVRDRPWGRRPWFCDLVPQIFAAEEWKPLASGMVQRLRAYEYFLRDVYGERRILRQGLIPLQQVLGSPYYQLPAIGLERTGGAYLHLSGMAIGRRPDGGLAVKYHYLSHASGISYMIQNRRALARVIPQAFLDYTMHSIADTPTAILELLRGLSAEEEPMVVLLSPGQGSAVYSEHSFLARRMGIPLVQGGDLLVLNDQVYLKTVEGLERVHAIYNRISDLWLDPLVFRRDSLQGVPGLVHCIRKGTVAVINAVGSQLVDDRALLPFAPQLIRYYLGESPILDDFETYWLGDMDQRALVLEDMHKFEIRPLYGEKILTPPTGERLDPRKRDAILREVLANPSGYVAQPAPSEALTICYEKGKAEPGRQDHILFAIRRAEGEYTVFPGALTRLATADAPYPASELGGGSKDTWIEAFQSDTADLTPRIQAELRMPAHHVTSRVAEAFYWIGRYLERARNLAGMIAVVEALETEELNPTERMLYRPVWNRMLPPLDGGGASRRTLSSAAGRYRLTLDLEESGSVASAVQRATWNGESVLECLSLEAWGVMSKLRAQFQRTRFRPDLADDRCTPITRRLCEDATDIVAQFFGVAQTTMIADGGWSFCELGEAIERAATTANALASMMKTLIRTPGVEREHAREIQLSAFLRLFNSRDVYRRVYQMRIEPGPVMQMLWQNPVVPRSVNRCLTRCIDLLRASQELESPATLRTLAKIERLRHTIAQIDWDELADREIEHPDRFSNGGKHGGLSPLLDQFLASTLELHHWLSDGFLNHQVHMRPPEQAVLTGFNDAV